MLNKPLFFIKVFHYSSGKWAKAVEEWGGCTPSTDPLVLHTLAFIIFVILSLHSSSQWVSQHHIHVSGPSNLAPNLVLPDLSNLFYIFLPSLSSSLDLSPKYGPWNSFLTAWGVEGSAVHPSEPSEELTCLLFLCTFFYSPFPSISNPNQKWKLY